uniref:probable BOI-related E3 ubiquitin-protein ligase 2 n=1 Tax=Erigeron canadensis TaxID=72917 RepID=UPI001CB8A3C8|nr:probable BOI-related E3 ubiquitin-protein ligase 2 [Erigeron canadensis]
MAVEATHHTLFHPQMLLTNNNIDNQINNNNNLIGYTTNNPMYGFINDSLNPLKSESGLTCSLPVSRKRPRDNNSTTTNNNNVDHHHMNHLFSLVNSRNMNVHNNYSFLGEDISLQLQQQQLEIDQFVAHHNEKMRIEVEERRKRNTQRIISAVEEGVSKRLRAKEEEIVKIAKLNWALEEKVKSLCVENQIWRELAQTNEATANTLRNNLKQVLEQVVINNNDDYMFNKNGTRSSCVDHELAEDAQSCCESNNNEEEKFNTEIEKSNNNRLCKKCGMEESCVLLLPCRHLCLCKGCASSVNICPICKSTKNISVHVNMS